jgi:hypothetical protein
MVSLADYPLPPPWRPLHQRRAAMAPRGLQRLSGLQLGRAIRDLHALEGRFQDDGRGGGEGSLLCARVFQQQVVSPGLRAMATAQLPMDVVRRRVCCLLACRHAHACQSRLTCAVQPACLPLQLWRLSFPGDAAWWQRVVGLVRQRTPHPDSWQGLVVEPQVLTSSSSCQPGGTAASEAHDLQELLRAACSCAHKCSCQRCRRQQPQQPQQAAAAIACTPGAKRAVRIKPPGCVVGHLKLPDGSSAHSAPATPISQLASLSHRAVQSPGTPKGSKAAQAMQPGTPASTQQQQGASSMDGSSSTARDDADWPLSWSCEDIACACRLVQAEQLLETAVHLLLGLCRDSSCELFERLAHMARGEHLSQVWGVWSLLWCGHARLAQSSRRARH